MVALEHIWLVDEMGMDYALVPQYCRTCQQGLDVQIENGTRFGVGRRLWSRIEEAYAICHTMRMRNEGIGDTHILNRLCAVSESSRPCVPPLVFLSHPHATHPRRASTDNVCIVVDSNALGVCGDGGASGIVRELSLGECWKSQGEARRMVRCNV